MVRKTSKKWHIAVIMVASILSLTNPLVISPHQVVEAQANCCPNNCSVIVPGTSNPWLAGAPPGTTTPDGDSAPAQAPVLVSCLDLTPGDRLSFTVFGTVSNCPLGCPTSGPDGGAPVSHLFGEEFGIPDTTAPLNSLLGIFLGPGPAGPPPLPSFFDTPALQNYGNLSPSLGQVFFIGDGRGSSPQTNSFCQGVIVPTGTTRLFLGTMDGFDWKNNIGSFFVSVCKQNGFCLQDDSNGNLLRFDAATGHYVFTRCSDGVSVIGTGVVTVSGCTISLVHVPLVLPEEPPPVGSPPFGVTASVNTCSKTGTASLFVSARRAVRSYPIKDTNTTNNTCSCPLPGLPDLVPDPIPGVPGPVGFCRFDAGWLVIRIKNQGTATSSPTFARVEFLSGESKDVLILSIPPDGTFETSVPFPGGCFNPDCEFRITVDVDGFVNESNESNNIADGICIG